MTATLTLTAAGRAALADASHRATQAVQLRRLAIGTGTAPAGTDDSARTALRAQREIVAVTGDTSVPARIALRADYAPTAAWSVTEMGLFARVGAAGDEFLFAYWVAAAASGALAAAVSGVALIAAGIVEITQSNAEIDVTLGLTVRVGASGPATTEARGIVELATAGEARGGTDTERACTPAALAGLLVPTGTVLDFAGAVVPAGYLLCDGRAVRRADYAALYAALGDTYGIADPAGVTFALPDYRRRVLAGSGGVATAALGNTLAAFGGAESYALPSHSHGRTGTDGAHTHGLPLAIDVDHGTEEISIGGDGVNRNTRTHRDGSHSHRTYSRGAGTVPLLQPTAIVHKIIKT